jgi:hypothetical protein
MKSFDLAGKKFGIWTAIQPERTTKRGVYWLCQCECGNQKVVLATELNRGKHSSCNKCTPPNQTHGMRYVPEYKTWLHMKDRCNNPNNKNYYHYGGRGIKVCERWQESFENFYQDMGPRPGRGYSVDRINNSGDYEPSNTRWATQRQQANNSRKNVRVTFNGETKTVAQWARKIGLDSNALLYRIQAGWDVERALTEPAEPFEERILTHNGKSQNMAQWAREIGINTTTLHMRINTYGWSVERALTEPVDASKIRLITFNGETKSLSEWAKELGINPTTLSNRINNLGWSVERALSTPLNKNMSRSQDWRSRDS